MLTIPSVPRQERGASYAQLSEPHGLQVVLVAMKF